MYASFQRNKTFISFLNKPLKYICLTKKSRDLYMYFMIIGCIFTYLISDSIAMTVYNYNKIIQFIYTMGTYNLVMHRNHQ